MKPPIVASGRGGLNVPAIIAGAAMVILTLAFALGVGSLFRSVEGKFADVDDKFTLLAPRVWDRVVGILRLYVLTAAFAGSVLVGLFTLGKVERRNVGDATLAFIRALAIAAVCQLALLVPAPFDWPFIEWVMQFALMCGIYVGLSIAFFSVTPRQSLVVGGVALALTSVAIIVAGIVA